MENGNGNLDHTPQVHEQLTIHSRHHSPVVTDLTNEGQFMNVPQDFHVQEYVLFLIIFFRQKKKFN